VFSSIINASFQQVLRLRAFEIKACVGTIIKSISIDPLRSTQAYQHKLAISIVLRSNILPKKVDVTFTTSSLESGSYLVHLSKRSRGPPPKKGIVKVRNRLAARKEFDQVLSCLSSGAAKTMAQIPGFSQARLRDALDGSRSSSSFWRSCGVIDMVQADLKLQWMSSRSRLSSPIPQPALTSDLNP
jgi:hypothetical protein